MKKFYLKLDILNMLSDKKRRKTFGTEEESMLKDAFIDAGIIDKETLEMDAMAEELLNAYLMSENRVILHFHEEKGYVIHGFYFVDDLITMVSAYKEGGEFLWLPTGNYIIGVFADLLKDIEIKEKQEGLHMVLLVVDTQKGIVDERLYAFEKFVSNIRELIRTAREQGIEVVYVQHDDGPGTGFSIGDDEFEVYSEFAPLPTERRFVKTVCSAFKKESGLLEYLTEKGEKDVMVCGIMTDFCINATVEAGFEHGLHMIVPAYANSTQDNEYMTGEQSYHYYNEFLWPDRYADCVPMDKALELLKK